MSVRVLVAVAVLAILGGPAAVLAEVNPFAEESFVPLHDTYATHDDKIVHGFEPVIRVGIEPQQCVPGGWDPCPDHDPADECCDADPYNYCAPPGKCADTPAKFEAFRKYRGYIRFNLNSLPKGKVVSASLRLTEVAKVQEWGGPFNIQIYALKKIGLGADETCEWNEQTLNDTNGTTWNVLPQNVSITPEGAWIFDVTKAVTDWVNGNSDIPGNPVMSNCGFHIQDADYGKTDAPIWRWVDFSSKEGLFTPQLKVKIAQDLDGDGYYADCDEEDPLVHPGALEVCDDKDNDCDGLVDEEDCDGLDNNCNGEIDEGDPQCPAGMTCMCHQCIVTCENECGGPTALKCEMGESGNWEKWGCKANADDDPCFDWYKADECKPGEFCQFGYCSGNCVDICDLAGDKGCEKDSTGKWYEAECDDFNADGCLEWGNLQYCGKGAICNNLACGPDFAAQCQKLADGGCVDMCLPDELDCDFQADGFNHVVKCTLDADSGCYVWTSQEKCSDPAKPACKRKSAQSAKCTADVADCFDTCYASNEGDLNCFRDTAGHWGVYKCGNTDKDACLEWEPFELCEIGAGCVAGKCTPGCSAQCDQPGVSECIDGPAVRCCVDLAGDGIVEWNVTPCDLDGSCEDGLCKPAEQPCEDECTAGTALCTDDQEPAVLFECIPGWDADPCLEWGNPVECEAGAGCNAQKTACGEVAQPEPWPEPEPDVVVQPEPGPDIVTLPDGTVGPEPVTDVVGPDAPPEDGMPVSPEATAGTEVDAEVEVDSSTHADESGCGCRVAGTGASFPAEPLVLLLLLGFYLARVRRLG